MRVRLNIKADPERFEIVELHGDLPAAGSEVHTEAGMFYVEKGVAWTLGGAELMPTLTLNKSLPKRRTPQLRKSSSQL